MSIHLLTFSLGWVLILRKLSVKIPFLLGLKIVLYSQLGKYLPGKVWIIMGRVYLSQRYNISKSAALISTALEMTMSIVSGLLIFLFSLAFIRDFELNIPPSYLITASILLLIIIHPKLLKKLFSLLLMMGMKRSIGIGLTFSNILGIILWYSMVWFCQGLGLYFFINSLTPLSWEYIPLLTGILAFSVIMGLLAFFSPGGLGVREGFLSFLLKNFFPLSIAILFSLIFRLLVSLVELILICVLMAIRHDGFYAESQGGPREKI